MNVSDNSRVWRGGLSLLALWLSACQAPLDPMAPPASQTQCFQWDEAFLALFHTSLAVGILLPFFLGPFLGVLGRFFWFFTAPRLRLVLVSLFLLVLVVLAVPLGPWTVGLGWGWFSGIDPMYFTCTDQSFGATGLLFGYLAPEQSALSVWFLMVGLVVAAFFVGTLLGLGFQALAARLFGIRRKLGDDS